MTFNYSDAIRYSVGNNRRTFSASVFVFLIPTKGTYVFMQTTKENCMKTKNTFIQGILLPNIPPFLRMMRNTLIIVFLLDVVMGIEMNPNFPLHGVQVIVVAAVIWLIEIWVRCKWLSN